MGITLGMESQGIFANKKWRNLERSDHVTPSQVEFHHMILKFKDCESHVSHEKNPPTFRYTGWLIGILLMVYFNPHITG